MHRSLSKLLGALALSLVMVSSADATEKKAIPKSGKCADAIEGAWHAASYNVGTGYWSVFDLEIHRTAPGASTLTIQMTTHFFWTGSASRKAPSKCVAGRGDASVMVTQDGVGTFDGTTVDVQGTAITSHVLLCGVDSGYHPDHFTGQLTASGQEFGSVNNDGGSDVNRPFHFVRTACF